MQSMTGFARAEKAVGNVVLAVEARSVNHRYLDLRFRLPSSLQSVEIALGELVRSKLSRGSVDISIRQKSTGAGTSEGGTRFWVDEKAAESFLQACALLNQKHKTPKIPSLNTMVATGKIFLSTDDSSEGPNLPAIKALVEEAITSLVAERSREGTQTRKALESEIARLKTLAGDWKRLAPEQPARIREKLLKRIEQWNLAGQLETQRVDAEIAFLADKADISEEIQRFEAHLEAFSKLLVAAGAVGRKLDFLTQELHREANTVASKADDLEVSRLAVEAKTAIEKLREQVQNVE